MNTVEVFLWEMEHSFTCQYPVRQASLAEDEANTFQLYNFGFFVKNQASMVVWNYFWVFDSISLINMSIFMSIPCSFYDYNSVVHGWWYCQKSFIVQDYFSYPRVFGFPYKIEYYSFKVCNYSLGILMGFHWICRLLFIGWPFLLC